MAQSVTLNKPDVSKDASKEQEDQSTSNEEKWKESLRQLESSVESLQTQIVNFLQKPEQREHREHKLECISKGLRDGINDIRIIQDMLKDLETGISDQDLELYLASSKIMEQSVICERLLAALGLTM